jgi:hypothetical protein
VGGRLPFAVAEPHGRDAARTGRALTRAVAAAALRPDAAAKARAHLDRLDLAGLTAGLGAGPAGVIPR